MEALLVVLAIRILVPLFIPKYNFFGAVLALLADLGDQEIIKFLGGEIPDYYQEADKLLDTYYLTIELLVVLKWRDRLAKKASLILYGWRVTGVFIFEITGLKFLLLFAPNIFENFYLLFLALKKIQPDFAVQNYRNLAVLLLIATLPKLAQEYNLHIKGTEYHALIKNSLPRFYGRE